MSLTSARRPVRCTVPLALMTALVATQLAFMPTATAAVTTLDVNTTADTGASSGACGDPSITEVPETLSLREATCLVNNGAPDDADTTINIPAGNYNLSAGPLKVATQGNQDVTFAGAGKAATYIDGMTGTRAFELDPAHVGGVTVTMSDLTIRRGADNTGVGGAAIKGGSFDATTPDSLTLSNVTLSENVLTSPSGYQGSGGAINWVGGSLTLLDTVLDRNRSGAASGAGVSYTSTGAQDGFTATRTIFTNNVVTPNAGTVSEAGGALYIDGRVGNAVSTVVSSEFTTNLVVGPGTSRLARGGAILARGGHLSVTRSVLAGNLALTGNDAVTQGAGGAFALYGTTATMTYNWIAGNAAGVLGGVNDNTAGAGWVSGGSTPDLRNNWWGCNLGSSTSCGTVGGTGATTSPFLVLRAAASPSMLLGPDATSTITSTMTVNSGGQAIPGDLLSAFDTHNSRFGVSGTGGWSLSASSAPFVNGSASVTFNSNDGFGPLAVAASVDQQTAWVQVAVHKRPVFTSADAATFTIGEATEFDVTTTGYQTPTLSHTAGTLPDGVTFVDNGDGTGSLDGTPEVAGVYEFTLEAVNGTGTATAEFTLTVDKAAQELTATSTPPVAARVGGSYDVAATASSGLAPAYAVTSATTNDACVAVDENTVSFENAGTCVVAITQAGNARYNAAAPVVQSFTVSVIATDLTVATSSAAAAFGQGVTASAELASSSGTAAGTVQFFLDSGPLGAPMTVYDGDADGRVSVELLDADGNPLTPGAHDVAARFTPADDTRYASAASNVAVVTVNKAETTTKVKVSPATVTATVGVVAPGAGTATGQVSFTVNGTQVGTADLTQGTAMLDYRVPAGATANVAASYAGDAYFTGSSDSTARRDPTITASLQAATAKTTHGWYRSPVTASFTCTTNGAELVEVCPAPVRWRASGAGQSVTKTISATDGGTTTVVVSGVNIDLVKPSVKVTGVRSDGIYLGTAPKATCAGADALSGIARCVLARTRSGNIVTYRATATDRAGNTATTGGTYRVRTMWITGSTIAKGRWQVKARKTYTLVVLSAKRPTFFHATKAPRRRGNGRVAMRAAGADRWVMSVTASRKMAATNSGYWNVGVKIGARVAKVRMHVRR